MHINLNQLRCLYMAARHKSMAEAAARLFVSPPAITMQIKKLEQSLGMKLVFRQHNELRLTKQGQRVYSHAVSIFEQVEKLESALAAMSARGMELLVGGAQTYDSILEAVRAARDNAARRLRGQIAPQKAIDLMEAAATLPLAEGMARERATFLDLRAGAQARALRHIFFAERGAGASAALKTLTPEEASKAGVA